MSPRSSHREDRRRRALADDTRGEESPLTPRIFRGDTEGPTHRYNAAALQAINAPIAKYIPLRAFHLVIWFLAGLVPIMSLMVLDQRQGQIAQFVGSDAARALDFTSRGNLASWMASVTFGFAVAVMLGTYSVRRFRRDDYRGRFTVWRWAIAAAIMISVDSTSQLHEFWQGSCEYVFQTKLWGDGSIWWLGLWTLLLGGMFVRLLLEMAFCRLAMGWALGASACYGYCLLAELNLTPSGPLQANHTSKVALLLLGHHLILFSLVTYAREVVLEAMGLLESPVVRRAKAQTAKSSRRTAKSAPRSSQAEPAAAKKKDASTRRKQDQPTLRAVCTDEETNPRKTNKKTNPKLRAVHPPEETELEHGEEEPSNLSKAERRRLRKERRRKAA